MLCWFIPYLWYIIVTTVHALMWSDLQIIYLKAVPFWHAAPNIDFTNVRWLLHSVFILSSVKPPSKFLIASCNLFISLLCITSWSLGYIVFLCLALILAMAFYDLNNFVSWFFSFLTKRFIYFAFNLSIYLVRSWHFLLIRNIS